MKKILSSLCAVMLTFGAVATAGAPAMAAPLVPQMQTVQSDAIPVQSRRDRFERRGDRAYYNGQRGYRERRAGYRRHNGFWFPAGAFIAGAVIGNTLSRPANAGRSHLQWCEDRYRSYRASDNSYIGNDGRRRACRSPY